MATVIGAAALALLPLGALPVSAQSSTASQPALLPAVHWDHNTADLQNLAPQDSHDLYYTANGVADPTVEHLFAQVSTNVTYPAVVLDHSEYVASVKCQGPDLGITFTDNTAYSFALDAWGKTQDFILVSGTDGCSTSSVQHTFWLIDHVTSGSCSECITAVVQREIAVEDAMGEVDMVWGTYTPTKRSVKPNRPRSYPLPRSYMNKRQAPDNSTTGTSGNGTCAAPPSSQVDGFPTAACGSTFDQDLDDAIGYLSFDEADYSASLEDFIPGLSDYTLDTDDGFGVTPSRLRKRQRGRSNTVSGRGKTSVRDKTPAVLKNTVNNNKAVQSPKAQVPLASKPVNKPAPTKTVVPPAASKPAVAPGKPVNSKPATTAKAAPGPSATASSSIFGNVQDYLNKVKEVGQKFTNLLSGIVEPPPLTAKVDINITPSPQVASPFGQAVQIYKGSASTSAGGGTGDLTVYCVDCGVTGSLQLSGQARWALKGGLTVANVAMNGNINAGVTLAIDATGQISRNFPYPIASANAPPGFSVPGLIYVGPVVSLEAEATVSVNLQGQAQAGINVKIPNFTGTLDFLNGTNSKATGFTPQLTTNFNANSQMSATAGLALPLAVGVGLKVPVLGFEQLLSINNEPSLQATFDYTASTTCPAPGSNACVNGIEYQLGFENSVYADILGLTVLPLYNYNRTFGTACKPVGPQLNCPAAGSRRRALADNTMPLKLGSNLQKRQNLTAPPGAFDYITGPQVANSNQFQTLNATAFNFLNSLNGTTTGNSSFAGTDDSTFTAIDDLGGNDGLVADPDTGNLYYANAGNGSLFAEVSNFVEGDSLGRLFHYYVDIMDTYGVSRVRLSDEEHIPVTADFVAFAPIDYNSNSSSEDVYLAVDTSGNAYYPLTCDFQDQPSKVFLATDVAQGAATLQDPNLRYTVTGGVVTSCYFIPWGAPAGSAEIAASVSNSTSSGVGAAVSSSAPAAAASSGGAALPVSSPAPAAAASSGGAAPAAPAAAATTTAAAS